MKKLILILAAAFVAQVTQAQNVEGETTASLQFGWAGVSSLIKSVIDEADEADELTTTLTPVFILNVDHALTDFFSLGVMGSFQSLGADFEYTWTDENNITREENVEATINRTAIALRPNFHYGRTEKLDLYSGFRVGYLSLNGENNSSDPEFETLDDFIGGRVTFGLTAFGMKYYVTDAVGLNMEISLGSPYTFAGGVVVRF